MNNVFATLLLDLGDTYHQCQWYKVLEPSVCMPTWVETYNCLSADQSPVMLQ